MLMITSSKGMLHWIFGHTTHLGPAVTLDGVLVVSTSSLEKGLIGTATSGNNTDLCSDTRWDGFLSTRRQTQTGGSLIFVVSDDNSKGTTASCKTSTVSSLGFDVTDDGSFRDARKGQDISDSQSSLLSAVYELTSVHTLGTDEEFSITVVVVCVQELNLGNGGTSARVVQDFLDHTANVTFLFSKVQRTELDGTLAGARVRLEDGGLTLTLSLWIWKEKKDEKYCREG
jgi:hypothetical protein